VMPGCLLAVLADDEGMPCIPISFHEEGVR
jgi:hypothetical protein